MKMTVSAIHETIIAGLKAGVNRHWSFAKEYLNIKPEYLLTVSVADEIAKKGFDSIAAFDIELILERPTKKIAFDIFTQS